MMLIPVHPTRRVASGLLALILATVPAVVGQSPVFQSEHHAYRVVTVVEGLEGPWSMAFLPGGDMLITERPGRLRILRDGVLQPEPIPGVPAVRYEGQGGLLEVALHPDFESNRLIYLSFAKPNVDGSQGTTAVVRGRFDGTQLTQREEIFVARAWSSGGSHYGSRLAFNEENFLFITIGERGGRPDPANLAAWPSQNLSSHNGTIVRLHDDGRVPADNPFVGRTDALPEIWSYGHRNPQGLAIDRETGDLWATEHGPQGGDELNLVLPGRNYGWPVIGYGVQYGGDPIHSATQREGMEQSLQYWRPSIATSGLMLYTGDRFPEWHGQLFAGGLSGQQLHRLPIVGGAKGYQVGRMERRPLLFGLGRIRDIRQGPDGNIYVAIDNSRGGEATSILRLEPAGDS